MEVEGGEGRGGKLRKGENKDVYKCVCVFV